MVNVAIVGIGAWGKNLVKNFHQLAGANLLTCCDLNNDSLKWVKENFSEINITPNYKNILKDDQIEAVVIATPPHTHFELAIAALKMGKDVLVEKPLTLSSKEAEILVEFSQKKGRKLMVGHIMKYHPVVVEMEKRINEGELGKIYYFYSQRLNFGRVRKVENAMWCLAPHDVSVALYLLKRYPVEVSAFGRSFLQKGKNIEDIVFLNLLFEDGMFASIHVSWLAPDKMRRITIVGDKKMMVFDDMESSDKLKIYNRKMVVQKKREDEFFNGEYKDTIVPRIDYQQPLKQECLHFVECIEKGITPRTNGEEGLQVVRILEAAQKSLKEKKPIKL